MNLNKDLTPNILLIGRTGAGKSELINYLAGKHIAPTGVGEPITQSFIDYNIKIYNSFYVNIIDSKGLEVMEYETQKEILKDFICKKNDTYDFVDWIHLVLYCLKIDDSRFVDGEIQVIKQIQAITGQNVAFILTNCENFTDENITEMKSYIKCLFGDKIPTFPINSILTENRIGRYPQIGKEPFIKEINRLLMKNASQQIVYLYSLKMCENLSSYISSLKNNYYTQISKIFEDKDKKKIPKFTNENLIAIKQQIEKYINNVNNKFKTILSCYTIMFNTIRNPETIQIKEVSSIYLYNVKTFFSQLEQYEIDQSLLEILSNSVQKLLNERSPKKYIYNLEQNYVNSLNSVFDDLINLLPAKSSIEKMMYDLFNEIINNHTAYKLLVPKTNPNDPCPCGSGKKFKKCCKGKGFFD